MLAVLGDYEFSVSEVNVRTFTDLKFSNSANYTEHKILSRKGLLEFTGLNASTCTLKIHLERLVTDNIEGTIEYFYEALNEGKALVFMLGEEVMGEGLWVITRLDEDYTQISNAGEIYAADLSLSLSEYLED